MMKTEALEAFKKKFPRVELNREQEELVGRMQLRSVKVNREEKQVELVCAFGAPEDPRKLFEMEALIKQAYQLADARVFPLYPAEKFSELCVPGLIRWLQRCVGEGVSVGFFEGSKSKFDREELRLEIRLRDRVSPSLVERSGAKRFLEECISMQFNLKVTVQIIGEEVDPAAYEAEGVQALRQVQIKKEAPKSMALDPLPACEAVVEQTADGKTLLRTGRLQLDITAPEVCYGTLKKRSALIPIKCIEADSFVAFAGKLFSWEEKENYEKEKNSFRMFVTDGEASVMLRFQAAKGTKFPKPPAYVIVEGRAAYSDFDGEIVIRASSMATVKGISRKETHPEPRVELHCHTNMSAMDALTDPAALIKRCKAWGCPAIAVTDHGNLQSFPEIMNAALKTPEVKPLYGMEGYLVDDTARAVFFYTERKDNKSFGEDAFVVFDIETTGLSAQSCGITQIAAVRYRGGKLLDTFATFVNPGMPIPADITKKTGITDEMVAGAPEEKDAVESFLRFADGQMLVAHNATFDCSFIRRVATDHGLSFPNSCLDTLALSRYINVDLTRHRLDSLARYFKLGDFNHHRADADTEMLARVFDCMVRKLQNNGINTTDEMVTAMAEHCDPKRLQSHHIILLAQNQTGLKNLYKLVSYSYLNYFSRHPRIPKTVLEEHREGLILGSACVDGELYQAVLQGKSIDELCKIAELYDYLEIQPWTNNWFLYETGKLDSDPDLARRQLEENDRTILRVAEQLGKPVCATGDVHFLDPEDELYRQILLVGQKFTDGKRETKLYLKTTEEMLAEFAFLGEETAHKVVVENPRKIADSIDLLRPIPDGSFPPDIPGAQEDLIRTCHKTAHDMYGEVLPEVVQARMDKELNSIIQHGYAVLYVIARNLVRNSEEHGYYVGSRGSVGSSFIATLAHISEVNPLPPHWRCPICKHSEFVLDGSYGSGFDMPDKDCPHCKTKMIVDGHDIPFETFLGFRGEKAPDIDLNFSGDVQSAAHKYTEVLFGKENIFRAGTVGTLQSKTCFGFVKYYLEDEGKNLTRAEQERLIDGCVGIKRTTGQHPGGIVVVPKQYEIYDFTPVQYPADKAASGVVTTHFAFEYLHDTLLKLDILGHDVPTIYRVLEEYTGKSIMAIPMNDRDVYDLFKSPKPLGVTPAEIDCPLGTLGLPEFGTSYAMQMIQDAKPQNFSDLVQISGISHGEGIWLGNAKDLIANGTCTINEVIGTRDSIMIYLMQQGVDSSIAFDTMERTRKGKGLPPERIAELKQSGVPDWYIESCQKIKYMFPKAHAAAYVTSALRIGWFKINYPVEFYATYFTVKADVFDGALVMQGLSAIKARLKELRELQSPTAKDENMIVILDLVVEMYARGVEFLPVRVHKSDATRFLPEDGKVRLPFSSLVGVGASASERICSALASGKATTVEELESEPGVGRSVVELLRQYGCLEGMPESNQLTMF